MHSLLLLLLVFYEREPDWESQKLVEVRTKIAHISAFSFASLTVSSNDYGSALTGPTSSESSYKSLK